MDAQFHSETSANVSRHLITIFLNCSNYEKVDLSDVIFDVTIETDTNTLQTDGIGRLNFLNQFFQTVASGKEETETKNDYSGTE